jgi:hypothetical protein
VSSRNILHVGYCIGVKVNIIMHFMKVLCMRWNLEWLVGVCERDGLVVDRLI